MQKIRYELDLLSGGGVAIRVLGVLFGIGKNL